MGFMITRGLTNNYVADCVAAEKRDQFSKANPVDPLFQHQDRRAYAVALPDRHLLMPEQFLTNVERAFVANAEELWIDPIDYRSELANAVSLLVSARMNVSIYNSQPCILDRSVWPYAAQSISDWKNGYIEGCNRCVEKDRCSCLRLVAHA
jgi:hypothetical protein